MNHIQIDNIRNGIKTLMISFLLHTCPQYSHSHSQFTFEANALCAFDNSARAVFCFIMFLRTIRFLYPFVFSFRTTNRLFLYSWCFLLILLSPWDGKCASFRLSTLFTWFCQSKLQKGALTIATNFWLYAVFNSISFSLSSSKKHYQYYSNSTWIEIKW